MSTETDIVERIEAERTARAEDPLRPANPLLREAAAEITKLRAQRDAAARALSFYADPFAWKAAQDPNDDISVPDFYSETSFGDTAAEALSVIATEQTGGAT